MLRENHATNLNDARDTTWRRVGILCRNDWRVSAYALLLVSIFLIIFSNLVHGDDLTGLPFDDPKDLMPPAPRANTAPTGSLGLFAPMPAWAHGTTMPALPIELKPMGGKTAVAGPPPPPPPLAPPKEPVTVVSTTASSSPTPAPQKNSAVTDNNPAMVTVSPFLQWIKNNPQAAALQARQQAAIYHAPTPPEAASANGAARPPIGAPGGSEDPYWLPPLIDSADFGSAPVTGSSAIYSTPQR